MRISSVASDPQARINTVVAWMLPILASPNLTGRTFPTEAHCTIFVDGVSKVVMGGSWNLENNYVYLPQEAIGRVSALDRLAIMAAIAGATGAGQDPRVHEALATNLVRLIRESATSIHSSIVVSTVPPTRLAINMADAKIAAEVAGRWTLPGGAPVEVDTSWTTLDF
jgi:hypothetical protein